MNLVNKVFSSIRWTAFNAIINAVLHLLQLVLLARFLSSKEYGVLTILIAINAFAQTFIDFGLSKAIIYKRNISKKQLNTLFLLNILLSIIIYFLLVILSPLIAKFYNEIKLEQFIIIMSISLIIQSFGQLYRTLFQKELKFNLLAKIDIFAGFISFILMIIFLLNGYLIFSIIYAYISSIFLKTCLLIYFGRKLYKPSLEFSIKETMFFFKYGLFVVGNGIFGTIASEIDIFIIGKILGSEILGSYSIVKDFLLKPSILINVITAKVFFPALAKKNNNLDKIKSFYLKIVNNISSISFPIYGFLYLFAYDFIKFFLGNNWLNTVYIFKILAFWGMIRSIGSIGGILIMALGKPKISFFWNIWMSFFNTIIFYFASYWGIIGISYANILGLLLMFIPGWYFLIYRVSGILFLNYINSFLSPLLITLIIIFSIKIICYFFSLQIVLSTYIIHLFCFIIGLFLFIVLYFKFNKNIIDNLLYLFKVKK